MGDLLNKMMPHLMNFESDEEAKQGLEKILETDGLKFGAYLATNIPRFETHTTYAQSTYPMLWEAEYRAKNLIQVDPTIKEALQGMMPIDWGTDIRLNVAEKVFFGRSREAGLGKHGLSIPVRGPSGDIALFSINSDLSDRDWDDFVTENKSDLFYIAHFYHRGVIERLSGLESPIKLTPKELELLDLIKIGKTSLDMSDLLKKSHRTVEVQVASLKYKLKATNLTQAVVNAIRWGLLKP